MQQKEIERERESLELNVFQRDKEIVKRMLVKVVGDTQYYSRQQLTGAGGFHVLVEWDTSLQVNSCLGYSDSVSGRFAGTLWTYSNLILRPAALLLRNSPSTYHSTRFIPHVLVIRGIF